MYARSTRTQIPLDRIDAWERGVEGLRSRLEQMEGYEGGYFLIDRKTGKALVVNFFDSERLLRNSHDASTQLRSEAWAASGITETPPEFETYEVAVEVRGRRRRAA